MSRFGKSLRVRSPLGNVYRVDGTSLRRKHTDFIGGGHRRVYAFVPGEDVWIEKMNAGPKEERYLLAHEMTEILLMRVHKWKYEPAHAVANRVEKKLRRGGTPSSVFACYVRHYFPRADAQTAAAAVAVLTQTYQRYK